MMIIEGCLQVMASSQNDGVLTGRSRNSISPVNNDELVPPRVNIPPGSSGDAEASPRYLSIQKLISGAESSPPLAKPCQKGVEPVEAMASYASPIIPDTDPLKRFVVVWSTATIKAKD